MEGPENLSCHIKHSLHLPIPETFLGLFRMFIAIHSCKDTFSGFLCKKNPPPAA